MDPIAAAADIAPQAVSIVSLWLPIVVSTVAVFFLSFAMWMVLPHHKGDWAPIPKEDAAMNALREAGVAAGQYTFPHCASKEQMKDPAFVKKFAEGPSGFLILRPVGGGSMGKNMALSTGFNLVITALTAYVATIGLTTASSDIDVFRLVTVVAWLGFAGALGWGPIWFARDVGATCREVLDGLVYGLTTGGLFTVFWPG